jgi:hypothetical protein
MQCPPYLGLPGLSRRTAVALAALALLFAAPGGMLAAPPPDRLQVIPVDDSFTDEFLTDACGFAVIHDVIGTIRVSVDTRGLFLARSALTHTLTGPGGSLSFPDVGIDKQLAVADDGVNHVETVMATGVLGLRIVIPGQGVVAANTGREVRIFTFDVATGELTDVQVDVDSGLDKPLAGAALAAVCAALGE